jgi:hypothetical protein
LNADRKSATTPSVTNLFNLEKWGTIMARVIYFYVPANFQKQMTVPPSQPGKVIAFSLRANKSA